MPPLPDDELTPQQKIKEMHELHAGELPEASPEKLDEHIQRKIDAATGKGLRLKENKITQSGESIMLRNPDGTPMACRRCGVSPCYGINYLFDGESRMKCDTCGKGMKLGYTQEAAAELHKGIDGMEKAAENRKRMDRDQMAEEEALIMQDIDDAARGDNPYFQGIRDRGFISSEFFS